MCFLAVGCRRWRNRPRLDVRSHVPCLKPGCAHWPSGCVPGWLIILWLVRRLLLQHLRSRGSGLPRPSGRRTWTHEATRVHGPVKGPSSGPHAGPAEVSATDLWLPLEAEDRVGLAGCCHHGPHPGLAASRPLSQVVPGPEPQRPCSCTSLPAPPHAGDTPCWGRPSLEACCRLPLVRL